MKNKLIILVLMSFFASCEYLESFKKKQVENDGILIASVGEKKLFSSDIEGVVPKNLDVKDSLVFLKGYVNSWAKQQILLQKSEENISEKENNQINKLTEKYRQSLYINRYKEQLIKQQLDTIITENDVLEYYESHKQNFKLTKDIMQLKYIVFGKNFLDKKQTIKKFKSNKEEDLEDLETNILNYKDYRLNDESWISYDEVLTKIPPFRDEKKWKVLNISKFIAKQDSLNVYLVAVNKVLRKNDIAPMSYIEPKIKRLIIYKRKFELIRKIEKTLINDAIKNNTFKEYN